MRLNAGLLNLHTNFPWEVELCIYANAGHSDQQESLMGLFRIFRAKICR